MKLLPSISRIPNHTSPSVRRLLVGALITTIISSLSPSALAQQNSAIKWDQPPAPATNVFYGWNQECWDEWFLSADDWLCTNSEPVTKIRWWGSFIGWAQTNTPFILPTYWKISIWTDIPKGADALEPDWSHPGQVIHQILATNVPFICVGLDYHRGQCEQKTPSPLEVETCYRWDLDLNPAQYFNQQGPSNVYWISITAVYTNAMGQVNYPFGIKTRPRDTNSPAPDAAIAIQVPNSPFLGANYGSGHPLGCPVYQPGDPTTWWDLAFELYAGTGPASASKWEQLPDVSTNGMDVIATIDPSIPANIPFVLADDFLCTQTGYITNIVIWGSWLNDFLPTNSNTSMPDPSHVGFLISIYDDVPGTNGFASHPGTNLWNTIIYPPSLFPGLFIHSVLASNIQEGWLVPPTSYLFPGDTVCHQYEFNFPNGLGAEPFLQDGTPANPKVYWLVVQASIVGDFPEQTLRPRFGWKTATTNWNDDAVWANGTEYMGPIPSSAWNELIYPPGHASNGFSADLAFRLNTASSSGGTGQHLKWSQPPVLLTNATRVFNGWNEPSIYEVAFWEFGQITNIVADDWLCTDDRPVSDIHWWGSFLGWQGTNPPTTVPSSFRIAFWKDVPQDANNPFSHPLIVEKEYIIPWNPTPDPNFRAEWVGWDVDPRSDCPLVESCFKFHYYIQDTNQWFYQEGPSNIYWVSIAADYPGLTVLYPFGWKTRPHVPVPPDDAVRIFDPLQPAVGSPYVSGEPIEYPPDTSWDMAFQLTTCQQLSQTNLVITNISVIPFGTNQIVSLGWITSSGAVYRLQSATYLSNAPVAWSNASPYIMTGQFTVTNSAANFQRYYRVSLPYLCP